MIRFCFHPTPNPAKVVLFLEQSGLTYELVTVDASKGNQHHSFRAVNPSGKVSAIVETDGPSGKEARVDPSAILLYLTEKTGRFLGELRTGASSCRGFSSSEQAPGHFQFPTPRRPRLRRPARR